jgi:multidrug efflux pump subunit AcrA (membrane-fusion protein)
MKPIFALALLVILGFAVAGCGSVKKTNSGQYTVTLRREVPSGPITVTGSATTAILNVKTDTHIRCKGWMGRDMRVPRLGTGLTVGESVKPSVKLPGTVKETELMSLTHRENGSITVACQFVEPR